MNTKSDLQYHCQLFAELTEKLQRLETLALMTLRDDTTPWQTLLAEIDSRAKLKQAECVAAVQ